MNLKKLKPDFNKMKNFSFKNLIENHYIKLVIILSVVLNFIVELLARLSFSDLFKYIITNPFWFIYNAILILFTFFVATIFRKRLFSIMLVSVIWIAAGITNSFLLYYRRTPFIAADFFVIKSALDVMDIYMTKFQMGLAIFGILASIIALIIFFIKEKTIKFDLKKLSILLVITLITALIPSHFIVQGNDDTEEPNLTESAYHYGFVCCFLNSVFNSGIDKPEEYTEYSMKTLLKKIEPDKKDNLNQKELPNIITIQLESFVDPYRIPDTDYSIDPIPNFRKLKENYTSGILSVAVYGGGTANTEFEVLTGMNVRHFGIGEYPFETVLTDKTVESVCYNLKEYGYKTHALHNHTGTFYDRNIVYQNLGFDTFTPVEYMNDVNYNKLGWEKSDVFTDLIHKSLNSTREKDFVFAVTSQCHGKYPSVYNNKNAAIEVTKSSKDIKPELEYFVNELYEEDKWLGDFIETLEKYDEPVMVVAYGDHMPSLDLPSEILADDKVYQTEYVIWTNYEKIKEDKYLPADSLMAYAFSKLGINTGIMTQLHQYEFKNDVICFKEQKQMQYDMIYGNHYLYENGIVPHKPTNIRLGTDDIKITCVDKKSVTTTIWCDNITPFSVVLVDGNEVDTTFLDKTALRIRTKDCKDYKNIVVAQKASNGTMLGKSAPYINHENK